MSNLGPLSTPMRRSPTVEGCFDFDEIAALVDWNYPDHEHTRLQLSRCLSDLVETAIREHDEARASA